MGPVINDPPACLRGPAVETDIELSELAIDLVRGEGQIQSAVMGWFDADEHPDLALAWAIPPGQAWSEVIRGTGSDFSTAGGAIEATFASWYGAAADVDGDGRQELAASSLVFFDPEGSVLTTDPLDREVKAVADFDDDGRADFVSGHAETVSVRLGAGDGTFSEPVTSTSAFSEWLRLGDFDGDGVLDLVAAYAVADPFSPNEGGFQLLRGQGDGSFASDPPVELPPMAIEVAAGDFDCDGTSELVVATREAGTVEIYALQPGTQMWAVQTTLEAADPSMPLTAELNADGAYDLVVAAGGVPPTRILAFPGDGQGGFGEPTEVWAADNPVAYVAWMSAADVFDQGVQSLIVTIFDNQLAVFHPPL